jgi:hypothetical protein
MGDELRKDEIACGVAEALAAEFGQDFVTETEKRLAAGGAGEGKRGFLPGWRPTRRRSLASSSAELKAMLEERAPH